MIFGPQESPKISPLHLKSLTVEIFRLQGSPTNLIPLTAEIFGLQKSPKINSLQLISLTVVILGLRKVRKHRYPVCLISLTVVVFGLRKVRKQVSET